MLQVVLTMALDRQLGEALNVYLSLMVSHPPLDNWHLCVMSDNFTLTSYLVSKEVLTMVRESGAWL